MSPAATATMTMTAAPMAMYVVVGSALVGGVAAWVGEGDWVVGTGVAVAAAEGEIVGAIVGGAVVTAGAGDAPTPMAVSASDGQ